MTPNIFEAEALTGIRVRDMDSANLAAHRIQDYGSRSSHHQGRAPGLHRSPFAVAKRSIIFQEKEWQGQNHGVGCTYSAALTSYLALDFSLKEAAKKAKEFAEKSLRGSMQIGKGVGPVNQAAFLREEADRFRVLCDMQRALDLIRDEPGICEVIPKNGSNLGMATTTSCIFERYSSARGKISEN